MKKLLVCLAVFIICLIIASCSSSTLRLSEIKEELSDEISFANRTIDDVAVITRQTNEAERKDIVHCLITSHNAFVRYKEQYRIALSCNSEGEWVMDSAVKESTLKEELVHTVVQQDPEHFEFDIYKCAPDTGQNIDRNR